MALYTRYVLTVDSTGGNDTQGSGSSAAVKDSDTISGDTLVITNAGGGSTVTKALAGAFAGPPVAGVDTLVVTDTVGGLGLFHIGAISGDNKTLTLVETPSTGTSIGNPWGVGGKFLTIARAALLVTPTNTNAGADDHCYVKAQSGYAGTVKVTFSKAASRSRCLVFEGYTTTVGDGGRATYDITATATIAFEPNALDLSFRNWTWSNSGAVSSWRGTTSTSSGRALFENCSVSTSGTSGVGFNLASGTTGHVVIRCRATITATAGLGFTGSSTPQVHAFNIAHDCGSTGLRDRGLPYLFCIGDSNAALTGTVGNFTDTGASLVHLYFCTAYNAISNPSSGYHGIDNATNTMHSFVGNIFANNFTFGLTRAAITAVLPITLEAFNDFFGNGSSARNNAEDTTGYDAAPTDLTSDPQFVNAAGQDFTIGANLKAKAVQVFQVGGTSYLDMGAAQRSEDAAGRVIGA